MWSAHNVNVADMVCGVTGKVSKKHIQNTILHFFSYEIVLLCFIALTDAIRYIEQSKLTLVIMIIECQNIQIRHSVCRHVHISIAVIDEIHNISDSSPIKRHVSPFATHSSADFIQFSLLITHHINLIIFSQLVSVISTVGKEGYEATARPPTSGSTTQTTATDDDSDEDPYATDGDSDEEFEPQDTSDDEDVFGGNTD